MGSGIMNGLNRTGRNDAGGGHCCKFEKNFPTLLVTFLVSRYTNMGGN
jgi:hypothetical protein